MYKLTSPEYLKNILSAQRVSFILYKLISNPKERVNTEDEQSGLLVNKNMN